MNGQRSNSEKFAKLLTLSAIREAQIKANPVPFLNEVAEQNFLLRKAINEALYVLSGASSMDIAVEAFPEMQPSIVETATIRMRKAQDVLGQALKSNAPTS